jgi:hypothetical protein
MKREHVITALRVAGYHADTARFTRLLIEERISKPAAKEAYAAGQRARAQGVRCDCHDCKLTGRTD